MQEINSRATQYPYPIPPTLLKCEPYNDVLRKRNTFSMGYKIGYWNCQGFNLKSLCCLVNRFKALRLIERYQPTCLHYHYIGQMILLRFSTLNTSCVVRFCRKWPDTTVAVPSGAPIGQFQRQLHHLGGNQWRVQDDRPWWSRQEMGRAKKQTQHELRQAQPGSALLLRQEHHDQGSWQEIRVQVRLRRVSTSHAAGPSWS